MPDDLMTESDADKAAFEAMKNEAPIELVQPDPEPKEPAKEPEPAKAAAEPAKEPEPKKPVRLVPHEALHEERIKRRELEKRLQDLEARQQQPRGDAEPDEHSDPIGAISRLKARIAEMDAERQQQVEVVQRNNEIVSRMQPRVMAARESNPAFDEQFAHVRSSRVAEYKALRIYSDQQIAQMVMNEELALAKHTLDNDLDPGEVIAALAETRGWKPKAPEPAKEPAKADDKLVKEAEAKLANIQKGQKAARSPSAAGGSGPEPEMTLEQLATLDGAAFDKAFAKHGRRLMGG